MVLCLFASQLARFYICVFSGRPPLILAVFMQRKKNWPKYHGETSLVSGIFCFIVVASQKLPALISPLQLSLRLSLIFFLYPILFEKIGWGSLQTKSILHSGTPETPLLQLSRAAKILGSYR